jgi:hypothetical protein
MTKKKPYALSSCKKGERIFSVSILTQIFYLLRIELSFTLLRLHVANRKNVTEMKGDKWMTTCPEKSRVNMSSYLFYRIVGVFIKNDFMMSFVSSSSSFLPFFSFSSPSAKKGNKNGKTFISMPRTKSVGARKDHQALKDSCLKALLNQH